MKSSIECLIYHIVITLIAFLLLILTMIINSVFDLKSDPRNHPTIFLLLIPIILYCIVGAKLIVKQSHKYDLLSVFSITIINTLLWIISFVHYNNGLLTQMTEETSFHWTVLNAFNLPVILFSLAIRQPLNTPLKELYIVFSPPVLILLGVELSRFTKQSRKKGTVRRVIFHV